MDQMSRHLESGYPSEACGALVGRDGGPEGPRDALEFHPMRNTVEDRPWDRYALDPLEQLRIQRDAERRGLEIIGFAHSHPDHPALPSRFDTDQAWPFYSYVVVSVERGRFSEARSFRLDEARASFREEVLAIV